MTIHGREDAYSCVVHFEEGRMWSPGERRQAGVIFFWSRLPFAFETLDVRVHRGCEPIFTGRIFDEAAGPPGGGHEPG